MASMSESALLIDSLHQTLLALHANPFPALANPPNCSRRASVALILRIRPIASYQQTTEESSPEIPPQSAHVSIDPTPQGPSLRSYDSILQSCFSQAWVKTGIPEVLFIKRAARRGDRWTSHIALPGGKRDPNDPSDSGTAERETLEEIGLDISSGGNLALLAGPLSQRVITTDFGAVPLMVLCPFVYLLTVPTIPALRLQAAEVASAHWIPISALLDPSARTYERADVVDRFASRWGSLARTILGWNLGQVLFAAVRLRPSESLFSPDPVPSTSLNAAISPKQSIRSKITSAVREDMASLLAKSGLVNTDGALDPDPSRRLLLWGLTHGIASDFLGLLPATAGLDWWRWPTLSRSDIRLVLWIVSWRFRRDKVRAVRAGKANGSNTFVVGEGLGVVNGGKSQPQEVEDHALTDPPAPTIYSTAGFLLDGYFEHIQRAVYVTLALRVLTGSALGWCLLRRYRSRRHMG